MKKILIATSALAVMTASSAFALDVKTTGAVEYRYNKQSINSVGENPKLSQQGANIKMAAEGASNGMGYGAWVNVKSATSTTVKATSSGHDLYAGTSTSGNKGNAGRDLAAGLKLINGYTKTSSKTKSQVLADALAKKLEDKAFGATLGASGAKAGTSIWTKVGTTQDGKNVYARFTAVAKSNGEETKFEASKFETFNVDGIQIGGDMDKTIGDKDGGVDALASNSTAGNANHILKVQKSLSKTGAQSLANNAVTQSAFWVSGSWGKFVVGQSGSAAGDNAISGAVSAASFTTGTTVAAPSADQTQGERYTYTAPTIVDGLTVAYTSSFKGNVDTAKTSKAKASSNWAVKYSTDLMGVALSVAHASGTTSKTGDTKTITNTQTGMTAGYGNFTVGYGVFNNGKKAYQKKGTSGTNYGVKYAMGDWSVGYTVKSSEDTNKYATHSNKSASTSAMSAKYNVASGFSVYASKSSNSVKSTNGTSKKNNYTIIGAKISF